MTRLLTTTLLAVTMTVSASGNAPTAPPSDESATEIRAALKDMDDAWNRPWSQERTGLLHDRDTLNPLDAASSLRPS